MREVISDLVSEKLEKLLVNGYSKGDFSHFFLASGNLKQLDQVYCLNSDQENVIFDLASLTKPLSTVPLTLDSLGSSLNDDLTVELWLGRESRILAPELKQLTIKSLLSHTSGLPAWANFWVNLFGQQIDAREELIAGLNRSTDRMGLKGKRVYSDLGYLLLGLCLEITSGHSIPQLFNSFKAAIGSKSRIQFLPSKSAVIAPTTYCPIQNKLICGEVHDENCRILGGATGHAGLFATGHQLLVYLQDLYSNEFGQQILGSEFAALNEGRDLHSFAHPLFGRSKLHELPLLGHLGFTGVHYLLNKDLEFFVLLTNRTFSGQRVDSGNMALLRGALLDELNTQR